MRSPQSNRRLLSGTSVLALSVGAVLATAMIQPANAASPASGLWGGGGTLSALTIRQIFDCYKGAEVSGDGYATSTGFSSAAPTPGVLPTACASIATNSAGTTIGLEGLYGAVGSGRGQQAYIANDALQIVNGGPNGSSPSTVSTPATKPPFIDTSASSTSFNTYPYPGLTFAAGDSPLPTVTSGTLTTVAYSYSTTTGWATSDIVTTIDISGSTTASYPSTTVGAPVQFPLFEVPVAVAVNTSNLTSVSDSTSPTGKDGLLSALGTPSNAGGAIQLSTAQVCAIFAGVVTDWGDSTTQIAALDASGNQIGQLFYADNVSTSATSTAQAYAPTPNPSAVPPVSTPIHVTYRSDGSGTSFIFTNYLKNNCVALDSGTGYTYTVSSAGVTSTFTVPANHYAAIFGASSLPSTSFSNLVNLVLANQTTSSTTISTYWQPANGSGGVAAAIGTGSTSPSTPGAIGYLSADYTTPYANTTVIAGAPNSASVQDEAQREAGTLHPSNGVAFIPPTPANADTAYSAMPTTVSTTGTYAAWNLYNFTYTSAGSFLNGKSILGIPNTTGAYPVTGTTYFYAYSCYANVNSATGNPAIVDYLSWYYNNGSSTALNSTVEAVLENNGFHGLTPTLASAIYSEYLSSSSTNKISPVTSNKKVTASSACSGLGGA